MARKNQTAKTAPPSAPAPQPIKFDPKFTTMLNGERTLTKLSPATRIWGMQQYENEIYEEIM
jgi:hypothetical protein